MIYALQGLRALCALAIFFHHFPIRGERWISYGGCDFAVAIFFILSGFVLTASKWSKPDASYWKYMGGRLRKIVPLNLIGLALAYPMTNADIDVWIYNALLIQAWIPEQTTYFGGNPAGWFLSAILFCYAMYPLILKYLKFWGFGMLCAIAWCFICPKHDAQAMVYVAPWCRIFDFASGVILWKVYERFKPAIDRNATRIILATVLVITPSILFYDYSPGSTGEACYWWPASWLTIITLCLPKLQPRAALKSIALTAGAMSLPFYVLQLPISLYYANRTYIFLLTLFTSIIAARICVRLRL